MSTPSLFNNGEDILASYRVNDEWQEAEDLRAVIQPLARAKTGGEICETETDLAVKSEELTLSVIHRSEINAFLNREKAMVGDPDFQSWLKDSPVGQLASLRAESISDSLKKVDLLLGYYEAGAHLFVPDRITKPVASKAFTREVAELLPLPKPDAAKEPDIRRVPVTARVENGKVVMISEKEDWENHDTETPPHISPADISVLMKKAGLLVTSMAVTATGLTTIAPVATAATSHHAVETAAPEWRTVDAPETAPAAQVTHTQTPEAVKPVPHETVDVLEGVNPALKVIIERAAKAHGQNPETLAVLYAHYAGPLTAAPVEKPNIMGFGNPEWAQYLKVAQAAGENPNRDNAADALRAASWLLQEQHARVPKVTGDPVIDAALAYRFGDGAMRQRTTHLTPQMKVNEREFEAQEAGLQQFSKAAPLPGFVTLPSNGGALSVVPAPANPNVKLSPVPASEASGAVTEKPGADILPHVNPAYKQIILEAAAQHRADPQLMVALFKTYNGTYTEALPHPLNTEEGWMGLSDAAARGINRDDFTASANRAAAMLAGTENMHIGDPAHLQARTALYEALVYRFGAGVIHSYMTHPHTLKPATLEKINEYKDYDFKSLTQLAAEAAANAVIPPVAHPAALPEKSAVLAPKPELPPSVSGQSQVLSGKILTNPNITVDPATPHDRVEKSLITNKQDGKTFVDDVNRAPTTTISPQLQQDVLVLANQGFKVKITSVTTGEHTAKSDHYKCYAIDIAPESGTAADYQKMVSFLFAHRDELKIDQLIYGGELPAGVQLLSQGKPLADAAAFYGQDLLNDHKTHIHISVLDSAGSASLPLTTVIGQLTPSPRPAPIVAAPTPSTAPAPDQSVPAAPSSAEAPQNTITVQPATPTAPTTPQSAPTPTPEAQKPSPVAPTALTPEQQALIDKQPLSEKSKQFEAVVLLALEQEKANGAKINVQVALDQAMLESGNGESNIVFGVKGGGINSVKGPTKEYMDGKEVSTTDSFKVYPDLQSAVKDYVHEIETAPWYADAATNSNDPQKYLTGLQSGGYHYATDPHYEAKINSRDKYLGLGQLAAATAAPQPPAPALKPSPTPVKNAPTSTPAPTASLSPTTNSLPKDGAPTASVDTRPVGADSTPDAGSLLASNHSQAPITIVQAEQADAATQGNNHHSVDHLDHGKLDRLLDQQQ